MGYVVNHTCPPDGFVSTIHGVDAVSVWGMLYLGVLDGQASDGTMIQGTGLICTPTCTNDSTPIPNPYRCIYPCTL